MSDTSERALIAENARLAARDQEWWRAACDLFNATNSDAEAAALGALNALKIGSGWCDVPEPVAKLLCDQRDAALAENARLREALKPFADWYDRYGPGELDPVAVPDFRRAAELLANKEG